MNALYLIFLKNKNILFLLFIGVFISCSNDNQETLNVTIQDENSIKSIGYIEKEEITLDLDRESLIKWYEENTSTNKLKQDDSNFKVITDSEGYHFLRFYNEDESATTFRIYKEYNSDRVLITNGISCTSSACAHSSSDCNPNLAGTACTKCSGDCEKRTTAYFPNKVTPI